MNSYCDRLTITSILKAFFLTQTFGSTCTGINQISFLEGEYGASGGISNISVSHACDDEVPGITIAYGRAMSIRLEMETSLPGSADVSMIAREGSRLQMTSAGDHLKTLDHFRLDS